MDGINRFLMVFICCQFTLHGLDARRILHLQLSLQFDEHKVEKSTVHNHNKTVVCVLDSWSFWRHEKGSFKISDIDPTLCSQLIYRNGGINNATYQVFIRDTHLAKDLGWVRQTVALSQTQPHLKVLLSIGGWNEGSWTFSKIAGDSEKREKFIDSVLRELNQNGFHGIDIAWEYPALESRGGTSADKKNLPLLLKELKDALGTKYILALTVAGDTHYANAAYDVKAISSIVDQINIRSFDYSGGWDSKAYHHSALRDEQTKQNVINSVEFYLHGGCPPDKIVMGVPFYGRTFLLKEDTVSGNDIQITSGLGQPSNKGFMGAWVRGDLVLGYHELCFNITNTNNWQTYRDIICSVPFARSERRWVSFDDIESIETKVNYAIQTNLKGIMAWTIDTDDFSGQACRGVNNDEATVVTYPLLRTINYAFTLNTSQVSDEIGRSIPAGPQVHRNEGVQTSISESRKDHDIKNSGNILLSNLIFVIVTSTSTTISI